MQILSYRGPSTPGGVSATLSRVLEQTACEQQWWYLHGSDLRKKTNKANSTEPICQLPFEIIEGHYRYCNEFLWPLFHELPQYASFSENDRLMYEQLNKSIAWNVLQSEQSGKSSRTFVNDYQLALCPRYLSNFSQDGIDVFWHIPWPETVDERFVPHLVDIVIGLLAAEKVGFHIEKYAFNFLRFIQSHLPDYKVNLSSSEVVRSDGHTVKVVAYPLGVDSDFWLSKLRDESFSCREVNVEALSRVPFALSVDRADYTKGVYERLLGIEHFFEANADKIETITFVQICQKTRSGLSAYESYWERCRLLYESINERWGSKKWQPIVWIDKPVSSNVLAWLYKRATIMLVTPLYDGLNLTAKEFALCSIDGVLILSARAGAWTELNENVLTLVHLLPENISQQICNALSLSKKSRKERMDNLRRIVLNNSLGGWWQKFGGDLRVAEKVVPLSIKIHHTTRRELWMAR